MTPNKELIRYMQEQGDSLVEDGSMSHWQALAQAVWKKALGFKVVDDKGEMVEYIPPDKASMVMLFDHMVGKPKAAPPPKKSDKKASKVPLHQRVGAAAKLASRVNKGNNDADTGGQDQTPSKGSLSKRVRDMAMRRNRDRGTKGPDKES